MRRSAKVPCSEWLATKDEKFLEPGLSWLIHDGWFGEKNKATASIQFDIAFDVDNSGNEVFEDLADPFSRHFTTTHLYYSLVDNMDPLLALLFISLRDDDYTPLHITGMRERKGENGTLSATIAGSKLWEWR